MKRKAFQADLEAAGGDYDEFRKQVMRRYEGVEGGFERRVESFRKIGLASKILLGAFDWSATGNPKMWSNIHNKLVAMETASVSS